MVATGYIRETLHSNDKITFIPVIISYIILKVANVIEQINTSMFDMR